MYFHVDEIYKILCLFSLHCIHHRIYKQPSLREIPTLYIDYQNFYDSMGNTTLFFTSNYLKSFSNTFYLLFYQFVFLLLILIVIALTKSNKILFISVFYIWCQFFIYLFMNDFLQYFSASARLFICLASLYSLLILFHLAMANLNNLSVTNPSF